MPLKRIGLTFLLLAFVVAGRTDGAAAQPETGFLKRSVAVAGVQRGYRVYIPEGFNAARKYPVVLFLHGSRQWGEDNEGQLALACRR